MAARCTPLLTQPVVCSVNAYCGRHLKQGPGQEVQNSKWRYSLMNWCEAHARDAGSRSELLRARSWDAPGTLPVSRSDCRPCCALVRRGCDPLKKPIGDRDSVAQPGKGGGKAEANGKAKASSPKKGAKEGSPSKSPAKSPAKGKADVEEAGDKRKPEEAAEKSESPKKAKK